jgi:hypothetical protein
MHAAGAPSRAGTIDRVLDAVVIESAALGADESLARIVVEACTAALAVDECLVGPSSTAARVWATVELDEGAQAARIELRNPPLTVTRVLRFAPDDSPEERWKSIGLVIGTLADSASLDAPRVEPSGSPSPERAPPASPGRASTSALSVPVGAVETPRSMSLWLDAGVIVGPALDDGTWRAGPAVAASYGLGDTPLSAGLSVRLTARPSDAQGVAVTWLSAGPGLGARLPFAERKVWVEPRAELVAEQMRASIDDSSGRADDAALWSAGARLSTLVCWMPSEAFGVWAGGEVTALQAGVSIRVARDETARLAPFGGALSLGGRVVPF